MLQLIKPNVRRGLSRFVRHDNGSIAITFAMLLIPMILIVGLVVDYARMVQFRSTLQNAVDEAALAGAAVFTAPAQSGLAQAAATNYFKRAILPASISVTGPTVSTNSSGTLNPALSSAQAYTVTVSASAKVATTLLSLVTPSATITATGTAGEPVISANLGFSKVNSRACDGNSIFLYKVPLKADGSGYDYSSVPAWSKTGSYYDNYYEIGSSFSTPPAGQPLPSLSANQPLGVVLVNTTDGNISGNTACGAAVTGANSYGAPYQTTQSFYSSYIGNGQSPSEQVNATPYTLQITTNSSGTITSVNNVTNPSIVTSIPLAPLTYNTLTSYLGVNAPSTGKSNCTSTVVSSKNSVTVTNYTCNTQYFTSKTSSQANCSLYVQTGVTNSYISGLNGSSTAPSAALGNCFSPTGGGAAYSAPTCEQLSALSTSSSGTATAPSAVFWWDDGGGVGPNEQYYGPSAHCSATSSGGPGYGEDCQYKNNYFAESCTPSGGSGTGYTEVVLTQ